MAALNLQCAFSSPTNVLLSPFSSVFSPFFRCTKPLAPALKSTHLFSKFGRCPPRRQHRLSISAALPPCDLTEENIRLVLVEARTELAQIFDTSVGMTGVAELAEVDGPFVKLSLRGRFWHKRSTVLARLGTYLKNRIPEILEVDIEDEKQLDDSPANF